MMKIKNFTGAFLLCILTFFSCKKDNLQSYEVQKVHPDADVMLKRFNKTLNQGPSAWQATLNPKSGGTYTMYIKMQNENQVFTLLDLGVTTAREFKAGTYRLNSSPNHASINFSSGTYFDDVTHWEGLRWVGADTSYAFKYAVADTVVLVGNRNGDELKLVNMTADQSLYFESGILGNSFIYMFNFFSKKPYFSCMLPDIGPIQLSINPQTRGILLFYGENGRAKIASNDYAYGINRIVLKYPIRIGNNLIKELLVDTNTQGFYIMYKGSRINLNGANMPIVPLHLLLGTGFSPYISLPSPYFIQELPGWSEPFHELYFKATNKMFSSLNASLLVFSFRMDIERDRMNIEVFFFMQGNVYQAVYPFSYKKTADGTYSFQVLPFQAGNVNHQNAQFIQESLSPLLDLVRSDSFKLNLYPVGNTLLAQMTSLQKPDIYFTGYMTAGSNIL